VFCSGLGWAGLGWAGLFVVVFVSVCVCLCVVSCARDLETVVGIEMSREKKGKYWQKLAIDLSNEGMRRKKLFVEGGIYLRIFIL